MIYTLTSLFSAFNKISYFCLIIFLLIMKIVNAISKTVTTAAIIIITKVAIELLISLYGILHCSSNINPVLC